ncbi:MAG TPA: type 1 glutamine amidotransferase domain-containing protein [Chitinophagaceae bacterium]|nr:type 1 glutamine amidotransferase domain-containing protein [Chitinophagaceae bacterium]
MSVLQGKRVAILTENGFEEVELTGPKQALEEAGATVDIVSPQRQKVRAWKDDEWSIELDVDVTLEKANAEQYDALVIPGGVMNPDKMRMNKKCVDFALRFLRAGKPVAAICHGPQLLIETRKLKERRVTSYPSLRTDLINAGATWLDKEVVVDNGLVTSRTPADIHAFNAKIIEEMREGLHVAPNLHD